MKLKFTILTLLFTVTFLNTYAQDKVMAKAFFEKARKAYAQEDYENTLKHIEKTKEYLEGKTNPDIIYLEAKAHYYYDLNINKAKNLLKQFLKDADPEDSKISEVASLLADIESNDTNFYENGNIKTKSGLTEAGDRWIVNYNSLGNLLKETHYYKNSNSIKHATYYFNNERVTVILFKKNGDVSQQRFLNNGKYIYTNIFKENQKMQSKIWVQKKVENDVVINLEIPELTNSLFGTFIYNNNKPRQYIQYNSDGAFENFIVYESFTSSKDNVKYMNCTDDYYLQILDQHSNNLVSKISGRNLSYRGYYIVYFDENGIPLKKEYFTPTDRLKFTKVYNKSSMKFEKK